MMRHGLEGKFFFSQYEETVPSDCSMMFVFPPLGVVGAAHSCRRRIAIGAF